MCAKQALEAHISNAAFLRTRIEIIDRFFAPGEVDEIWITFPDPFPRASKENRRLTAPFFLEKYRHILRPGGLVHMKRDEAAAGHHEPEQAGAQRQGQHGGPERSHHEPGAAQHQAQAPEAQGDGRRPALHLALCRQRYLCQPASLHGVEHTELV